VIDDRIKARVRGAKIDELAAVSLIADIDDAVQRRSVEELRAFGREAELSGLDQEASRAFEIADVIETKSAAAARDEVLRIKSALEPAPPTQAELVRQWDSEQLAAAMSRGAPFDVNTFDRLERERAEIQNAQLAEKQRRHEEQRRAQVAQDAQPKGPGRR
jgi:hypothetical protein